MNFGPLKSARSASLALLMSALVPGCGGGGGSSAPTSPAAPPYSAARANALQSVAMSFNFEVTELEQAQGFNS